MQGGGTCAFVAQDVLRQIDFGADKPAVARLHFQAVSDLRVWGIRQDIEIIPQ
jgi:hypothetical protein